MKARTTFRWASALGVLMFLTGGVMTAQFPSKAEMGELPRGFSTPIVAFELVTSRAEVEAMFASDRRANLQRAMDRGNRLDYVFLALYGAFLAMLALGLSRSALVPALLAAAADAVENVQLFAITRALGDDYSEALQRLYIWTRIKWGALALALVLLAPGLRGGERVVAAVCVLTGLLALAAAVERAYFMELFAGGCTLAFLGLLIVAIRRAR